MATVRKSHSPFSSSTSRSRAGKLEIAQHHSRNVTRREEDKNREISFLIAYSGDPLSLL
jgi:hypothetical protein